MVKSKKNQKSFDEKFTNWMGSMPPIYIHTFGFIVFLSSPFWGVDLDKALLVLTTIVSLEAIYLALFIQISINRQTETINEVSEDIEDISEDIEDIQEDVEELHEDVEDISESVDVIHANVEEVSKDVEEISEDVEEMNKNVDELSDNVEEISKDVDELSEDMDDIQEDDEKDMHRRNEQKVRLEKIERILEELLSDINSLKSNKK